MKRNAFTLAEILLVVIILGILATIAFMNMTDVVEEQKAEGSAVLVKHVRDAVQNFRMKIKDSTATPSISALQSNGLVTATFAAEWSISYSDGEVSNVVAK